MNGLQAPPGYEEIEEKKKPLATPRILSPPGYEKIPDKPPSPTMPVKEEPTPIKPPTKPGDWKKELIGGLAYKAAKRSYDISTDKYIEPMRTKKYWIEAGKNLSKGVSHFLQAVTGMPGIQEEEEERLAAMRGAVGEERPSPAKVAGIIGKEVGKMGFEFAAFLPKIGIALAVDPVKEVKDNPAGVGLFVLSIVGAAGGKIRAKTKAGKPVLKQDMAKAIDSIPESILTKKQKAKIKPALPEQLELPLGKVEPLTPAQKIINALKPAKVIRKQQEALYTEVRGERFPKALEALEKVRGRKGFEAAKGELKGKMRRVEIEPIVQNLTQADVESLFNQIIDSRAVVGIDKISAGEGLAKLLGEKGGVIPTASELALLNKVYPKELVQTILSKRATWDKVKAGLLEGANVPRALMASYDLSFGLRQGVFLMARFPKEFGAAFLRQFKLFGSKKAFKALNEDIVNRPTYKLMKRGGGQRELALTEMDAALSLREEAFMGAALAEKIPVVGLGVKASNRAYTGFANKLRADVFDHLIKSAEKTGRNPWKDPKLVDGIINFVNAGSGRGNLPKVFEKAAVELNTVLFSPRLMSSRMSLLNPKFYVKLDPFVRKQALQSLFAFAGMTTTVLALAKLAGAEVETNMRSADAGKITIGDTRIDIMGGFQQYIRTAVQFITGEMISTTTGKVTKTGEGYKPISRGEILGRGLEYKLAPVASFAVGIYRGRSAFGGPFDIPEEIGKRFVPMVMQDVIDLAKEDPELLPLATLGFFGTGLQTYKAKEKEGVVY
jgi:hypothetical protein